MEIHTDSSLHLRLGRDPLSIQSSLIRTYLESLSGFLGVVSGLCELMIDHTYSTPVKAPARVLCKTELQYEYSPEDLLTLLSFHGHFLREARLKSSYFKVFTTGIGRLFS